MINSPKILYSDESIVVINKPSGLLSIPDRYDPDAPVALSYLEKDFGHLLVVHRIDKDTSGVLLYARDAESHRILNSQFLSRTVEKSYLAIVRGRTEKDEWDCDDPLLADADRLHRTLADSRRGKAAYSHFTTLERFRDFSLVQVRPETGRTHQVRVHCAATGYPIVSDPLYGDGKPVLLSQIKRKWKGDLFEERPLLERTGLHAERLAFTHPLTRKKIDMSAPLPKDMSALIAQLKKI
ncbi:MAG TPA: RluA family pseudouridine synthase [Rectinemataceae bacterium]|nr:RluA family pseudouridine synthase [Rectinemataceae bacterium]